ncbi:hypothetical protein ACFYNL_05565 [Streptomyces sp. NPDC007808]|uniref:hypothetical protein n=1 Tax=Streptomyces sp. NPDC007808 TaxID=3364779 RepID=UPI0036CBB972
MGGTWIEETLSVLRGTSIGYLPFAGEPWGTPRASPATLTASPTTSDERRPPAAPASTSSPATDADPLDLVRVARAATIGRLVIAGIHTDQIQALAAAGADAFTLGSAAFDGTLQPHARPLRPQLAPVVSL